MALVEGVSVGYKRLDVKGRELLRGKGQLPVPCAVFSRRGDDGEALSTRALQGGEPEGTVAGVRPRDTEMRCCMGDDAVGAGQESFVLRGRFANGCSATRRKERRLSGERSTLTTDWTFQP